jgi:hypothetical protein
VIDDQSHSLSVDEMSRISEQDSDSRSDLCLCGSGECHDKSKKQCDHVELIHEKRREDLRRMLDIMHKASGEEPKMGGPSVVGFGDYHCEKEVTATAACACSAGT